MGLGKRTAKQTGDGREAYLLDLTKPYHNLLGMVRGDDERSFYWDGNIEKNFSVLLLVMNEIENIEKLIIFNYNLEYA